jgi:hypothetical protein
MERNRTGDRMSDDDLVRARNTRTGEARKIDEWSVPLPGGDRARFDVTMRYEHGICVFAVRSEHPDFKWVRPHDSDLNRLRALLAEEARAVIEGRLSEDWDPATMLEISHKTAERREGTVGTDFSLSLRLRPVERLGRSQEGNMPVATIRDAHRQERVVLRGHAEDFTPLRPRSGSLTDPEVKSWMSHPISRDPECGLGRIVRKGDGAAERELLRALDAFATGLSGRLSPDRVSREGVPDPDELVELMREAAQTPEPPGEEVSP